MRIAAYTSTIRLALLLLATIACYWARPTEAIHYRVPITASSTWIPPSGAYNLSFSASGGGGGAAHSYFCGAGGGSAMAFVNRYVNADLWNVAPSTTTWDMTIGAGGAGSAGDGGNGGATVLSIKSAAGAELYRATAHGGGGGHAMNDDCKGGGGGGADGPGYGFINGGGVPAGGNNYDTSVAPTEGAQVGDIKAGGAGGSSMGSGVYWANLFNGASWGTKKGGGGFWDGGNCRSAGGAAGFNGVGASGGPPEVGLPLPIKNANANSGAGGGSEMVCAGVGGSASGNGGSGVIFIEYDVGSSWQLVNLNSSASAKYLSANSDNTASADRVVANTWERWNFSRLANGKGVLKSFHGKYLTAQPDGSVWVDRTAIGNWEQLIVIDGPVPGQIGLKTYHGTYLTSDSTGKVRANADAAFRWTKTAAAV